MSIDIIVAGVGGQGSILASHIIAEAAILADKKHKLNVRVGETFGAAMRGGAVASHVRIGEDVYGPLVGKGQADMVLALEPLEGLGAALASGVLPFGQDSMLDAVKKRVPQKFLDVNVEAFRMGMLIYGSS